VLLNANRPLVLAHGHEGTRTHLLAISRKWMPAHVVHARSSALRLDEQTQLLFSGPIAGSIGDRKFRYLDNSSAAIADEESRHTQPLSAWRIVDNDRAMCGHQYVSNRTEAVDARNAVDASRSLRNSVRVPSAPFSRRTEVGIISAYRLARHRKNNSCMYVDLIAGSPARKVKTFFPSRARETGSGALTPSARARSPR